ncbi:MAG: hypothetical protein ING19_20145 [Azospirillum sp.]|nr:hypothetical protein [Azospirillum sp.]
MTDSIAKSGKPDLDPAAMLDRIAPARPNARPGDGTRDNPKVDIDSDIPIGFEGANAGSAPNPSNASPTTAETLATAKSGVETTPETIAAAASPIDSDAAAESAAASDGDKLPGSDPETVRRVYLMGMREVDARLRSLIANADRNGIPSNDVKDMIAKADATMKSLESLAQANVDEVRSRAEEYVAYVEGIEAYVRENIASQNPPSEPATRVDVSLNDPTPIDFSRNSAKVDRGAQIFEEGIASLDASIYNPASAEETPEKNDKAKDEKGKENDKGKDRTFAIPSFGAGRLSKSVSAAMTSMASAATARYLSSKPEIHLDRARAQAERFSAAVARAKAGELGSFMSDFAAAARESNMDVESYRASLIRKAKDEGAPAEKYLPKLSNRAAGEADDIRACVDKMLGEAAKAVASAVKAGKPTDEIRKISDWILRQRSQIENVAGNLPVNRRLDSAAEYAKARFDRLMEAIRNILSRIASFFGASPQPKTDAASPSPPALRV